MKKLTVAIIILIGSVYSLAQKPSTFKEGTIFSYKIIASVNNTWGYDIYYDDRLIIHQPSIPALPGNSGFSTKESAEIVAKKVIDKIKKGENPPTISIDEMKKLGVIEKN